MKKIFILIISIILFSCSSNKQVNDESPYAIQIKEVRSIFKAEDVVKRLDKFDINSYIIAEEGDDGTWYRIISGSEKSLDEIQKHKDWLDEKADFKELKIINYQNIKSNLVEDYRESKKEQERIKTLKPDIPEKIYEVISKFPDDDNFIVKNFFIVNCPDSIKDIRKFREGYNVDHDLPRGISMKSLMKRSECIAEVIYEDNLFEDRVTIDIVKLKKDHGINIDNIEYASFLETEKNKKPLQIANYFAELILETGKYSFEDKVKINVSSYQKFIGYKVTIKPSKRKDEYRTYFILVSKDMNHVIFSQSTEKTEEEIMDIIKSLGEGEGLNSYDEFYNSFYTLPSKIKHDFICFTTEKLSRRYARERNNAKWAKKMVGHWNSTAHFYSEEHKNYVVSFFDLLYENQVDYIYKTLYIDAQSSSSRSFEIDVKGKTGITFKGTYPSEVSFPSGRNVIVTANRQSGKLKLADMLEVCESMQLTSE
tara:strand:- start:5141 stop:6583 length:1443 start_codon:yes stop_codon:yes gene_type:complete